MASFNPSYRLDVKPPKRNVFVTQLNDREDEEEETKQFPIVKESAAELIKQGINTLQKTLLLRKEVEVEKIDNELAEKRDEFKRRMEACAERQIEIQKNQQKMRDRVAKFEKFIKENEAKRRRAIQKYQSEVKLKEQKDQELELLLEQLNLLKAKQEYLRQKVIKYKIFEDYLNKVIDILPAHYLEVNDNMINSLMMRHRTLSDTNHDLLSKLLQMSDEIEEKKQERKEAQSEHDKFKFSVNSQLSIKKKEEEKKLDRNEETEQKMAMNKDQIRQNRTEFGVILMAIENLAEKCRRRTDPEIEDTDDNERLQIIQEFLIEKQDVAKLVNREMSQNAKEAEDKAKK